MTRALLVRLRALLGRARAERELDEELRYHLDREIERQVARGLDLDEARAAARRAFGNTTQHKEAVRDSWGWRWLEELGQDARYAIRGVGRAPLFALTVVATIALALGLNTTVFTIFDAYVLRPVAARDPASLVQLSFANRSGQAHVLSWNVYQRLRERRDILAESFAFRPLYARLDGSPAYAQLVTANYFEVLGIGAALGRTFGQADGDVPGEVPLVVISDRMWRARFGADSQIVGRTIRVRGAALQVVGVTRRGFEGIGEVPIDFWVPLSMIDRVTEETGLFGPSQPELLFVVGRMPPGLGREETRARLTTWARSTFADRAPADRVSQVFLISRATALPLSTEVVLLLTPIVVAFVLILIMACANVANMMLARGMARQREIGIRLSLGAARARLVRQLLTEAVVLALPAALVGFVLSRVTIDVGVRLMFATLPPSLTPYIRVAPLAPDLRIFVFMTIAAVVSAVLFGLAPALQATRPSVVQATRGDFETERRPARLRNVLIVCQVTVCVLLLVCAGLLLRGSRRLEQLDVGIRTRDIVQLTVDERFRERALERLRMSPDISVIAAAERTPLDGLYSSTTMHAGEGAQARAVHAFYDFVSPAFFPLLEIPIVRGRNFSPDEERDELPVVIVSEGAARALWPGRDPIGETVRLPDDTVMVGASRLRGRHTARVVGVAADAVHGMILSPPESPVVYYPTSLQSPWNEYLLRVNGGTEVARRHLDVELSAIDPALVREIHNFEELLAFAVYPFRAAYWVAGALGVIALLLTLSGIYGVLAYLVAQRRKELGIRMALGASPGMIVGSVLRQSVRLSVTGLLLGAASALVVSRVFASYVVVFDLFDPVAYVGSLALVLATCLVAAYAPSRRAAAVDPVEAFKAD
jgi:predicted permease